MCCITIAEILLVGLLAGIIIYGMSSQFLVFICTMAIMYFLVFIIAPLADPWLDAETEMVVDIFLFVVIVALGFVAYRQWNRSYYKIVDDFSKSSGMWDLADLGDVAKDIDNGVLLIEVKKEWHFGWAQFFPKSNVMRSAFQNSSSVVTVSISCVPDSFTTFCGLIFDPVYAPTVMLASQDGRFLSMKYSTEDADWQVIRFTENAYGPHDAVEMRIRLAGDGSDVMVNGIPVLRDDSGFLFGEEMGVVVLTTNAIGGAQFDNFNIEIICKDCDGFRK